jgi:hypothetical protein
MPLLRLPAALLQLLAEQKVPVIVMVCPTDHVLSFSAGKPRRRFAESVEHSYRSAFRASVSFLPFSVVLVILLLDYPPFFICPVSNPALPHPQIPFSAPVPARRVTLCHVAAREPLHPAQHGRSPLPVPGPHAARQVTARSSPNRPR